LLVGLADQIPRRIVQGGANGPPRNGVVADADRRRRGDRACADPITSVVLTGGARTPSDALVGSLATSALSSLNIDVLFMGVHGIDPDSGYSTPNLAEAEVNRAFINSARRVVVLADHTKWGTRGLAQIAPLERADLVISDTRLPDDAQELLRSLGIDVALVATRTMAEQSAWLRNDTAPQRH